MKTKQIQGFPDYFVSDNGIVYSMAKRANRLKPKKMKALSYWDGMGYKVVQLHYNKKPYKRFVHRLVLEAFIGKAPKGHQSRHLDANKLNNNLSNLKWGTRSENQRDRLLNGTDNRGEKHGMNKLTEKQIIQIRKMGKAFNKETRKIDCGGNYREIAEKFKVASSTIGSIIQRRTWNWLK